MSGNYFSGSSHAKVDDKNRFVLPQQFRYQLVENGKLEFTIAVGMNGCLAIYKTSDMEKIVEEFRKKQHLPKFQSFFTFFFSTLFHTTCDKIGRVALPATLKKAVGIEGEMVLCGAMNKIEIWPKARYEEKLSEFLFGGDTEGMDSIMAEAFSMLSEGKEEPATTTEEEWKKIRI